MRELIRKLAQSAPQHGIRPARLQPVFSRDQFRIRWRDAASAPDDPETMAAVFTWMLERSCHQLIRDDAAAEAVARAMATSGRSGTTTGRLKRTR